MPKKHYIQNLHSMLSYRLSQLNISGQNQEGKYFLKQLSQTHEAPFFNTYFPEIEK